MAFVDPSLVWLPAAQRLHAKIATMVVALACLLALSPPSIASQAVILLAGVGLVGMPHGSFDHIVAQRVLRPRLGPLWWLAFLLVYLALAGLVWLGWILAPRATLVLFLAFSLIHFGLGDRNEADGESVVRRFSTILARGALPILLPIATHPLAVTPVLAALAGGEPDFVSTIVVWSHWLLLLWAAALAHWLVLAPRAEQREVLGLCAAFVLLPPILAFAIYFCVCHSIRHLLRLAAMMSPFCRRDAWRRVAIVGLPATLVCFAASPLLMLDGVQAALVPLFRLLAALTLPHMVVTLWLEDKTDNQRINLQYR